MIKIPVARPDLRGNEEAYVVQAVRSSWIGSKGAFVKRFEDEYAALCQARSAISVCNGTAALHLALLGMDLHPGDEVLIPSFTYVATANVVRYVGAEPVFVDVDAHTWCLDPQLLEAGLTPRTRGIIVVDLYGHPADLDAIQALASAHGLWVIEDAAEALTARYKGQPIGGLSTLTTFSFYGNKIITCGEGGAITLNDPGLDVRLRSLHNQAVDSQQQYFFSTVGYNYRMTNLSAAILCAQMERLDEMLRRRRQIYQAYTKLLGDIPGIGFQPVAPWAEVAPWLFCITVEEPAYGRSRDELAHLLEQAGVETRPFFIPLHQLPPYRQASAQRGDRLPVTEQVCASGLSLPTYTELQDNDIELICDLIRQGARRNTPRG